MKYNYLVINNTNKQVQLGLGAFASFAVGIFVKNSMLPMVLIMTVSTVLALIILILGKRNIKKTISSSTNQEIETVH